MCSTYDVIYIGCELGMLLYYGTHNMESGTIDVGSAMQAHFSRNLIVN